MAMRRRAWVSAAAILLCVGLVRGAGGVYLAVAGRALYPNAPAAEFVLRGLGILLTIVSLLAVLAAVALWRGHPRARGLAAGFLVLFPLDGALNGVALFGHMLFWDILVNCLISVFIASLLWMNRMRSKHIVFHSESV